jgi:hypothetical protein
MNDLQAPNATLPANARVLPDAWVVRLFERMSAMYGSKFSDLWAGVDPANMRAVWADKLGGFAQRPEIIKAALDACDDRPWPPTLPEFMGICREAAKRSPVQLPALPAPDIPADVIAARLEVIRKFGESFGRTA